MCGISGIVDFSRPVDRDVLQAMTGCLDHRGPDASGLRLFAPADGTSAGPWAGLGHRRLSIIDLSDAGTQPMTNEDRTLWLVFNGEIYNFCELADELKRAGHRFTSRTDSEVLLHGWEEWGEDLLPRLNGMFAIALWDDRAKELILARDRYGKKPLYYWRHGAGLAFASEQRAFRHHPDFSGHINLRAVSRYLLYEYVPAPHALFEGLAKLPPGHLLRFSTSGTVEKQWWDIDFSPAPGMADLSEAEAVARLQELVRGAVRRRLVSDVPLGVFLSGGLDSSTILSFMAEDVAPKDIKTFSIGFTEPSFDESAYARAVAKHFGTDHSEHMLDFEDLAHIIPEVWAFMDDPIGDASLVPTYVLSKFTRKRVTVALGGDGGDEIFAGYDPFLADRYAEWYSLLPRPLHRCAKALAQRLPVSFSNISLDFKIKQFLKGMDGDRLVRPQYWMGSYTVEDQHRLLSRDALHELGSFDPANDVRRSLTHADLNDRVNRLVYYYSKFYLADCILPKVDRASMAVSLEVRSPFLDRDVTRFVNGLPSRLKMRGTTRKYILKKLAESRLPGDIVHRKKKGFGIPVAKLLHTSLNETAREAFSRRNIEGLGIFNADRVEELANEHFAKRKDNRKILWTLLCLLKWMEFHA